VLNVGVTHPVLDRTGIVALVGQRVTAAVPKHVEMDGVLGEASALGDVLELLVQGVAGERAAALGLEDVRSLGLSVQLTQGADLVAFERVDAGAAALDALDVKHGIAGVELDLRPFEVGQLLAAQAVPVRDQDQGGVAMAVTARARGLNKLVDLGGGQVFALACSRKGKVATGPTAVLLVAAKDLRFQASEARRGPGSAASSDGAQSSSRRARSSADEVINAIERYDAHQN